MTKIKGSDIDFGTQVAVGCEIQGVGRGAPVFGLIIRAPGLSFTPLRRTVQGLCFRAHSQLLEEGGIRI